MSLPADGIDVYLQKLSELDASDVELVIAPSFPYISHTRLLLASLGSRASVGAQNCSDRESGAFTGEVSAGMLRETGARYVIVGHSERRTIFGETDETIAGKLLAASTGGVVPLFCIGEDASARSKAQTNAVLTRQIESGLSNFPRQTPLLIAYEPVWAIGTGQNATAQEAGSAHQFIRQRLATLGIQKDCSILYGGSVTPANAAELAAESQIDGFLVGGASLQASKFRDIYEGMLSAGARTARTS